MYIGDRDSLEKKVSTYATCCLGTLELLKENASRFLPLCSTPLLCSVHISQSKNKMKNKEIKLNKESNSE